MAKKSLRSSASRPSKAGDEHTLDLTSLPPAETIVRLPKHAGNRRNLDFAKHYGKGCDVVVYACQRTLERMASSSAKSAGKTLSPTTISTYFGDGLSAFLPHCATMAAALERDLRLDDIDRGLIDHFIAKLRQSGERSSQKQRYSATKPVLVALGQSGWIAQDIFPRNPFPNYNRGTAGQRALSEPERKAVLKALKVDMRDIIKGSGLLTRGELSVCLLAIAARTGINPTPALELITDCLQPHPLKADRYVLVSYKRRGNATHIQSLRRSADIETMVTALPDVARIIDLVRKRNSELRKQSSHYASTLFVYESSNGTGIETILRLNQETLRAGIKAFCQRHDLHDADKKPLALNLSRLRKTFENRLFSLSGQDPFLTAKLGGHTPKVSNDYYLEAPETAERDWHLMGEIRTEQLLGKVSTLPNKNTPVAKCRDTLMGDLAPKNGKHCQKFLACFRCKSFVVTGEDLYRVFSLYWMLVGMRRRMGGSAWKRVYGHIIRIIDQDIATQFDDEIVAIQRQRAKADPHPFWRDPELLEIIT
ncbi:hypothetical protein [Parahalioglobus pacificus]|uniref:Phage integrase SAM-like domain-containing protein n=1 Tax=Parahalioglobus pacificus TaxID=930806 RepID=A0A919CKK4_9GAMM|nr:hypothetical protein [Halioglobus pacificus]GHD33521.1 hypothetical protein GCM10007053_17990 [Halioglobus pacificus]